MQKSKRPTCGAQKFHPAGFLRNVTLLHSKLLLSAASSACHDIRAQLIRCSFFLRLEHRAKASSSLYRCPLPMAFWRSRIDSNEKSDRRERICTIERLALHHEVFRSFACCKLSVLKELVGASGFEPPSSWSRTMNTNPINALSGVA